MGKIHPIAIPCPLAPCKPPSSPTGTQQPSWVSRISEAAPDREMAAETRSAYRDGHLTVAPWRSDDGDGRVCMLPANARPGQADHFGRSPTPRSLAVSGRPWPHHSSTTPSNTAARGPDQSSTRAQASTSSR